MYVKQNATDLEKLARFCTTLAMRVSVRDVCSSGYSWVRLKRDGDMMAGHRKRRKREPLMRRSAMSSRPLSAHRTLQEAKTSFSSRGKTLRRDTQQDQTWTMRREKLTCMTNSFFFSTDQWELTILQSASSQHIRRLAWWSGSTEGGVLMGSTSQFSSDSYKALMNSPTNDISLATNSRKDLKEQFSTETFKKL